jgi:hypothetical protein
MNVFRLQLTRYRAAATWNSSMGDVCRLPETTWRQLFVCISSYINKMPTRQSLKGVFRADIVSNVHEEMN